MICSYGRGEKMGWASCTERTAQGKDFLPAPHSQLLPTIVRFYMYLLKGKGFPYSLPSIGPGADTGA